MPTRRYTLPNKYDEFLEVQDIYLQAETAKKGVVDIADLVPVENDIYLWQGDYGLFQCSKPCCDKIFDNEKMIMEMMAQQKNMKIPTELVPKCPYCGRPLTTNLRADDRFVQDEGWYQAAERYDEFCNINRRKKNSILGIGGGV